MQECRISKNMLLSTVTEAELDDIVMEITRFFHQMLIAVKGELERQGIRVIRARAQEPLQ